MADGLRSPRSLSRRRFLSLTAAATAASASTVPGRRASAQARTPRPGGTLISAKTTEAPSLEPILEQALGRIRLDPIFYNRARRVGDGREARAGPGRVVDDERRRQDVDLQAPPRRQVPQRPRVRGRRRQVQLRAGPRPQGELGRARLPLGHRRHGDPGQVHAPDPHQAAERVAPRRHGGRLVVDHPEGGRRGEGRPPPDRRRDRARSSSRSGCPRATSRRGRTPTTGTRGSRTSTPSSSRSSRTRRTSSPSSARATSTTRSSRTTRTTSWSRTTSGSPPSARRGSASTW